MKKLLTKELKLFAAPLTYFFIAFALMTLLPGYPILCGAFFVCLGIFKSFQTGRETNDILYTVLLPIKKSDAVKARFIFVAFIELVSVAVMAVLTVVRMTVLSDAAPYVQNVLMSANPVFLAFTLLIFAMFNLIFVRGYFRTAYATGKPFIVFIVIAFVIIGIAEALHHVPGLAFVNSVSGEGIAANYIILAIGAILYVLITLVAFKASCKSFETVDL